MNDQPTRIDGVEVDETSEALSVALFSGGTPVLIVQMRDSGLAEEVVNPAGEVVHGPVSSWTLIDGLLTLEYNTRGAKALSFPKLHRLWLQVSEADLRRLCDALLEILSETCCVVDTPEGRIQQ